ncbi:MAG: class I tRNA ligase family protein [Candidatus Paceibacterota bacterium]
MKKIFITTAIDYVNGLPHIGHALEKIQADVLARRHRKLGDSVYFISGTDENSLKNVQSAEKANMEVREYVDENYHKFANMKQALNLTYDDFIRTTEERHKIGAQKLWQACQKDIYKKNYGGLYCVGCEEFYKEEDLVDGLCPEHKKTPEYIEEENYFFKLSNYSERIKEAIEKDEIKIVPTARKNEILSFINSGLQDFCISRSRERANGWGIDVPNDPSQKIWVWFDALANYITALGYGGESTEKFEKFWLADDARRVHVIGKGITRFHAIYWPAMLMSAGLPLPKLIFSHGYITVDGQKISKSIGNVIDPFELSSKYGSEAVRYFLLAEIPALSDGDFTYEKLEKRYNSDLAKGLGNLFARTLAMVEKASFKDFKITPNEFTLKEIEGTKEKYNDNFYIFNETLKTVWGLVSSCDKYIEEEKPWSITDDEKKKEVFSNLLYSLKNIAELIEPFLPVTAEKMRQGLGENDGIFNVKKCEPLFPMIAEK